MDKQWRVPVAVVAGSFVLATVIVIAVARAVPEQRDELWIDLAKAGIQLAVVIGLGGVLDEHRFEVFRDVIAAYHQLKSVRRNLRTVGLRDCTDHPLRPEQIEALRSEMATVVEVQLTLEQMMRELDARSTTFARSAEIALHLSRLAIYVDGLVEEWEKHGRKFWADHQPGKVSDLKALQAFLGRAADDFRPRAADPLGRVEQIVREELLGRPSGPSQPAWEGPLPSAQEAAAGESDGPAGPLSAAERSRPS
jgi:hypothetical protein